MAQCGQPLGLAFEGTLRRLCPSYPPRQHHLYANASCDPGGASWEPSQVSAMLLGRGPWASGMCPGSWPAKWDPVQLSPTLSRGGPSGLLWAPFIGEGGPGHAPLCPMPSPRTLLFLWVSLVGSGWGWGLSVPWGVCWALDRQGSGRGQGLQAVWAGQQALLLSLMELASISRHWGGCNRKLPSLAAIFSTAEHRRKHCSLLSPASSVQTPGRLHPAQS